MPSGISTSSVKRWSRLPELDPPVDLPYRAIVERQSELISVARRDGTLVFVNPAYAAHFGFMPAAMIGTNLFDFIEPADREGVAAQIAEVLRSGRSRSADNRMLGADGTLRWVEWTNHLQGSAQGQLVLSIGRDATQRKLAEIALRASEALSQRTARMSGVGGWQVDLASGAVSWSEETRRLHEVGADFVPTLELAIDFYAPEARPVVRAAIETAIGGGPGWDLELPFVTATGRCIQVRAQGEAECEHGLPVRLVGTFQDITERIAARRESTRQADILRSVTDAIPATVVVVDSEGRYRFVNGAFERHCGLPRERLIGRRAADVLGAEEIARRRPWIERALAGELVNFTLDYRGDAGVTHLALTCIPLRLESGALDGFVGVSQDITAQKREEHRLTRLAQRDLLTGLLNRAGFEQGMDQLTHLQPRGSLAIFYIDLDDFKPVNDRHGHPAGDFVLRCFAERLAALVRPDDLVARLGGDEFAIAIGGLPDRASAEAVARKIVAAAQAPFESGALQLHANVSVGLVCTEQRSLHWRDLLALADAQLLAAKAAGKGRWSSLEPHRG